MPAPDYESIYDVEGAVEPAIQTVLGAAGFAAFTQRGTSILPSVRVDIQLSLGEELETRGRDNERNFVTTGWRAQLLLRLVTPRFGQPDSNGNPLPYTPTAHGRMKGKLRRVLQHAIGAFTVEILPYHVVTQILSSGSSPQLDADEEHDVSELAYACVISVRQGAWPVPPVPELAWRDGDGAEIADGDGTHILL